MLIPSWWFDEGRGAFFRNKGNLRPFFFFFFFFFCQERWWWAEAEEPQTAMENRSSLPWSILLPLLLAVMVLTSPLSPPSNKSFASLMQMCTWLSVSFPTRSSSTILRLGFYSLFYLFILFRILKLGFLFFCTISVFVGFRYIFIILDLVFFIRLLNDLFDY